MRSVFIKKIPPRRAAFLCVLVLLGCPNALDPEKPEISSVTVSPADVSVAKGGTQQFSVTVAGTGDYSDAVVWSIDGNAGAQTTISASGLLSVAADEAAETLTVTAASAADNTKYGRAAANISQTPPPGPTIASVTISPASAFVTKGETLQFSADVAGTGAYSTELAWTVDGNTGAQTTISESGLLSVAADESAATLTVTARSAADSAKYGIAAVALIDPPAVVSVTVHPANISIVKGKTQQFSVTVAGTGDYSDAVVWTVDGNTGVQTSISESGLLSVAADETAAALRVTAASAADNTKSGGATVNVVDPVLITSVMVSPGAATVIKGGAFQFSAAVTGTGAYSTEVVWTVGGASNAQTAVSAAGLLTVAANETAAALTVTAASAADNTKSGSAEVAVAAILPRPTGLKVSPGIKQIAAGWDAMPGAASYELWYAVSPGLIGDAVKFAVDPALNSAIITGLEDSTVYNVWVKAKDSGGNVSNPSGSRTCRKTSDPVNPFWYSGDFAYWDSQTDGYEITETTLGYNTMPPWSGSGVIGGFGYMGDIRYYAEFDPEETARIAPKTQIGKWGESLAGYPAGVFIIEYREDRKPAGRPGDFFGVYFYGLGAPQTTAQENFLTTLHKGDRLAYLGNSIGLSEVQGGPQGVGSQWDPETKTLEEAIERFTLENIGQFIAYVATPWYRISSEGEWVKGGTYP
jgi:hypothetical protein